MAHRIVFPLRRRSHLSREDFQAYWWDQHGPLVASVASHLGIVGYQQVHTTRQARATVAPEFDGVAELWIDPSWTPTDPAAAADAADLLLEDERRFIDHAASPIWVAEEELHLSGDTSGERMTALLRRNPNTSRQQFRQHWSERHGPWALRHPEVFGFRHYVQLHAPADDVPTRLSTVRNAPPAFDGVSEIYRDPPTAPEETVAKLRRLFHEDEASFLAIDQSPVFYGNVRVVIDRQHE